jgi:hypothetical protein
MLENINVRFFVTEFEGEDENTFEIPHQDFVERYAEQPSARIDIEHCTVRSNGIRQLCITLNDCRSHQGENIMNREELVAAMDAGLPVRWKNDGYQLFRGTSGEYLKTFKPNGWTIGVFHRDGIGMNVDPKDCYIKESK